MQDKIKKIIDKKIKPILEQDGGSIELVSWDEKKGIAKIRVLGACKQCPMFQVTFPSIIKEMLQKEFKEIKDVEVVN